MSASEMRRLAAKHRDFQAESQRQHRYILWRIKLAAKMGCFQIHYYDKVYRDVNTKLNRDGFHVYSYNSIKCYTRISWGGQNTY